MSSRVVAMRKMPSDQHVGKVVMFFSNSRDKNIRGRYIESVESVESIEHIYRKSFGPAYLPTCLPAGQRRFLPGFRGGFAPLPPWIPDIRAGNRRLAASLLGFGVTDLGRSVAHKIGETK